MKAAVWTSESFGPALVCLARADQPADTASVPNCPPGPLRQWSSKGHGVTWRQWAEHLADKLPHIGQWSVQEVPDGCDAAYALRYLRQQHAEKGLTSDNPDGSVADAVN